MIDLTTLGKSILEENGLSATLINAPIYMRLVVGRPTTPYKSVDHFAEKMDHEVSKREKLKLSILDKTIYMEKVYFVVPKQEDKYVLGWVIEDAAGQILMAYVCESDFVPLSGDDIYANFTNNRLGTFDEFKE